VSRALYLPRFPQQWASLDASDFHQKDKYGRTAGKSDDLKGKEKRLIAVAAVENACAVLCEVLGSGSSSPVWDTGYLGHLMTRTPW
jgi:hypothetical protein